MDPSSYIGWDISLPSLDIRREFADLNEQPVIEHSLLFVVAPQADSVGRSLGQGSQSLLEASIQTRLMRRSHQVFELAESGPGIISLTPAGEEHPQAAGSSTRFDEDTIECRCHIAETLVVRKDRPARYPIRVKIGKQSGLYRRPGIRIQTQPNALCHRTVELAGRGNDLSCRLGSNPRYLLKPAHPRGRRLTDRAIASRLDDPKP